ncbi:MAG: 2,3-bisphosphoglycerate-independent phosphoglycerate mutase, partial [Candidatus Omnitrophica bacterium]|nr:2,3-bisphosphoglycerate-independent phosphoglycerate mutase [Candidatus Omnitrophota bacterium]
MKYVFLVGDGMQDRGIKDLEGKTPLEVAKTPNMDYIACHGRVGWAKTIPPGKVAGSDVAIMSLLGYSPVEFYTGRGPLEAANLGVELNEGDIAFRCNLVTVENGSMVDYSAGHILTKEADALIRFLNEKLASDKFHFYTGTSYRHLMVSKGVGIDLKCTPPHDISGKNISAYLPKGEDGDIINDLMQKSSIILPAHDVNHVRIDLKENPANMIWLWGQGRKPLFPAFSSKYGLSGKVISAVDLIKGLGRLTGL